MPAPQAYVFRGSHVLEEIKRQYPRIIAEFAALLAELQFAPRDSSLGVRPFKAGSRDYPDADVDSMFTVPFGGGLLLHSVQEDERVIDFKQVIWVL